MVQWVNVLAVQTNLGELSSKATVEGEKRLSKVILWHLRVHHGTGAHTSTHILASKERNIE